MGQKVLCVFLWLCEPAVSVIEMEQINMEEKKKKIVQWLERGRNLFAQSVMSCLYGCVQSSNDLILNHDMDGVCWCVPFIVMC